MPTMSTKPDPDVGLEGEEDCYFPCWKTLPDHLMLHIFSFLGAPDLHQAGLVCKSWLRVAFDELLWKDLFYRHWQISRTIPMAPGKYSWIQEYKRLLYHTPLVESEVLKQHADQVLHVSFSHNGKMFATCSKDGFIRVWDATYPTSLKYKADMRKFTWKYTQFSQFNSTDTLLLVSGVHFGSLSTSGEIAVFSLEGEFAMQSRVMNKPYDVFGTWYNDCYLLSGNLHWTGHLNSCSAIWLNKAYQETSSEEESVVMRLFKFSNINASSIRIIMVANCLTEEDEISTISSDISANDGGSSKFLDPPAVFSNEDVVEEGCYVDVDEEPDDKNEQAEEGAAPGDKPKKSVKNVQSIQVYENGTFITKFLEVDEDEPNTGNRLNGTIHYSNDYRMAEWPGKMLKKIDTSGSELSERSTNGNFSGSECSENCYIKNPSGSDVSEKSVTALQDVLHNSLDMDIGKIPSGDMEDFQGMTCPDGAQGEDFMATPMSSNAEFHISDSTQPMSLSGTDSTQNLFQQNVGSSTENADIYNHDFSPQDYSSVDFTVTASEVNNFESVSVDVEALNSRDVENMDVTFDIVLAENMASSSLMSNSGSDRSKTNSPAPKRVLHGQQQEHGEIMKDPASCDLEITDDVHSCSNATLGDTDPQQLERNPKLAFCCVDYKKQKKSVSSDSPLTIVKTDSFKPQTCAPAAICSGNMHSSENIEIQSMSDVNIETCIPVKTKCNTLSGMEQDLQSPRGSTSLFRDSLKSKNQAKTDVKTPRLRSKRSVRSKQKKIITDKFLIFTKGSKTYTPHQIGIKRIKPMKAFSADGSRLLPNVAETTHGAGNPEEYDEVDHLIDMHGHIIGMSLSPDQRYLYVNSRPWPKNYQIENPLYPPPIAQEIDIHVIDLLKMMEVGTMHRSHKAYTSNDECFFIFLDVCDEYVASGAEDKHGYLWDRHYGLCLHRYPHSDVVNSVAFNPSDPEVLITVSDDFSIKIWRSLSREKEVVKAFNREHCIRLKHVQAIMSETDDYVEN